MRELERKEQEMLSKLQNTYQAEKLEINKLQSVKNLPTKEMNSLESKIVEDGES